MDTLMNAFDHADRPSPLEVTPRSPEEAHMSTNPQFRIRDAVPADLASIEVLALRAFRTAAPEWAGHSSQDEARWLTWVAEYFVKPIDGQYILVAEGPDGDIWGISHVLPMTDPLAAAPHPHLESLAVAEHAEGRGVASGLLGATVERSRAMGGKELSLHVYVGNNRAQSVYERLGFDREWLRMRRSLE
jgi:ribosomal protein S18 acetylase RimI-like enzyme